MPRNWIRLIENPHLRRRLKNCFTFVKGSGPWIENAISIKPEVLDHERIHCLTFRKFDSRAPSHGESAQFSTLVFFA